MKPLFLSDFDGVINAPSNHLYWVENFDKGINPDPELQHYPDRVLDPSLHFDTDSDKYHQGTYGLNKLCWSSELVDKYRHFITTNQVEFMWFSGWKEHAVEHLTPLFQFPNATQYVAPVEGTVTISDKGHVWKIDAIIELYKTQPVGRPFIWLDDVVTEPFKNFPVEGEKYQWLMEQIGNPPALIIHTDERYGVTRTEMFEIEKFVQKHQV